MTQPDNGQHTPGPIETWIESVTSIARNVRNEQFEIVEHAILVPFARVHDAYDQEQISIRADLLAALERLLKFNEELCEDIQVSTHYPSADAARAAIAKARGVTQ